MQPAYTAATARGAEGVGGCYERIPQIKVGYRWVDGWLHLAVFVRGKLRWCIQSTSRPVHSHWEHQQCQMQSCSGDTLSDAWVVTCCMSLLPKSSSETRRTIRNGNTDPSWVSYFGMSELYTFLFFRLLITRGILHAFSLSFSVPRRNSDAGLPSRLFSPLPTTALAFIFIARTLQPFLTSSTSVELRHSTLLLLTIGALAS